MHPLWISFALFALFLAIESMASWIFIRGSRKHHHELWMQAGRPSLIGDSNLIGAWGTNRYLLQRRHLELADISARQFAERLRLPMLIGYFGSWLSVAVFVACLGVFGKP